MTAIHDWFAAHVGSESGFAGVGHRVVHGGSAYTEPVLIDDTVLAALEALVPLAPLHEPHNIAAIRAVAAVAPDVPQVACFDTAFHHDAPPLAQEFGLPRALTAKGIRRYGFHGLSYEYIVSALPRVAPECAGKKKLIVAHLGNGASMCAIADGRSIASTMGFTAVDGLVMGTRTGALDPGVLLYLLAAGGHGRQGDRASHLFGVRPARRFRPVVRHARLARQRPPGGEGSGRSLRLPHRPRTRLADRGAGRARRFRLHRRHRRTRARKSAPASAPTPAWIGITLDAAANAAGGPRISRADSKVSAWVIPTDENLMIARHTRALLDGRDA